MSSRFLRSGKITAILKTPITCMTRGTFSFTSLCFFFFFCIAEKAEAGQSAAQWVLQGRIRAQWKGLGGRFIQCLYSASASSSRPSRGQHLPLHGDPLRSQPSARHGTASVKCLSKDPTGISSPSLLHVNLHLCKFSICKWQHRGGGTWQSVSMP